MRLHVFSLAHGVVKLGEELLFYFAKRRQVVGHGEPAEVGNDVDVGAEQVLDVRVHHLDRHVLAWRSR
jgi:hypothetical protein